MAIVTLAEDVPASLQHTVIFWCVTIILVTLAGFGLIAYIKRYMMARAAQGKYDTGFSLSDLRAMRDRGEITPEEYEQTRARVIAKVKGRAKREDREKMEAAESEDAGSNLDSGDAGESPESGKTDMPR
jgi:hypothetical protein